MLPWNNATAMVSRCLFASASTSASRSRKTATCSAQRYPGVTHRGQRGRRGNHGGGHCARPLQGWCSRTEASSPLGASEGTPKIRFEAIYTVSSRDTTLRD